MHSIIGLNANVEHMTTFEPYVSVLTFIWVNGNPLLIAEM